MGTRLSYREERKRKDGNAKYTIEVKNSIHTYRGEDGKLHREIRCYRRIVKNENGEGK